RFPYTTLFRSVDGEAREEDDDQAERQADERAEREQHRGRGALDAVDVDVAARGRDEDRDEREGAVQRHDEAGPGHGGLATLGGQVHERPVASGPMTMPHGPAPTKWSERTPPGACQAGAGPLEMAVRHVPARLAGFGIRA